MILPSPYKKHQVPPELVERAYDSLFSSFRTIVPLSTVIEEHLRELTHVVLYQKDEIVLDYGEVCNYILFPFRGIIFSLFINEKGEEKIVWIMGAGDVIIAPDSWYSQTPSEERLQAIKETITVALSWENLQILKDEHPEIIKLVLAITERHIQLIIRRTKWQQFDLDEMIDDIVSLNPRLFQEVPAKDFANFLGISRATLYRKQALMKKMGK